MQSWQLPDYIADILPSTARQLENAKESLLALFRVHGYELVSPPLLEYSDSLLTKIDEGLSLKTIRIVDQISGYQLGLRADITPQVARIDAHLLSTNNGINRLCYAGSVLHAQPDGLLSTREPLQIGAELYGYEGIEADIELIDLMLKSLQLVDIQKPILTLGHIGIFNALAAAAKLTSEQSVKLLELMQNKDTAAVHACACEWALSNQWANAFSALPALYGNKDIIKTAMSILPDLPEVRTALYDLQTVCAAFPEQNICIDLSELRVDAYHTGLLFAAYHSGWPDAIARGGRYNGLGSYFGRSRPATGFSFDLRDLIGHLPQEEVLYGIKVNAKDVVSAKEEIDRLRSEGQCVIIDYMPESNNLNNCNRQLVWLNESWQVIAIES